MFLRKMLLTGLTGGLFALSLSWILGGFSDREAFSLETIRDPFASVDRIAAEQHLGAGLVNHLADGKSYEDAVPAKSHERALAAQSIMASLDSARPSEITLVPAKSRAGIDQEGPNDSSESGIFLPMLMRDARLSDLPVAVIVKPEPVEPTPEPQPTQPGPSEPNPPGLTYWKDAYPIIAQECSTCHYTGGIAPFALESYEDAFDNADLIRWSVEEKIMPPLPANPDTSAPFDDPRKMVEADRQTLIDWVAAGAPEGNLADKPEIEIPEFHNLGDPTFTLDIGVDYSPPADMVDDYRCFVLDLALESDIELRMVDVEPTSKQMFHHGILYLAAPDEVETVEQLDAADPGPGYSCFGGPGFTTGAWLVGEAASQLPSPYPAGTARIIQKGSKVVLQQHYNTLNGVYTDRSEVHFWQAESRVNDPPRDYYLVNPLFLIPPGKESHIATADLNIARRDGAFNRAKEGWLWQVWGHQHVLGKSFALDLIRADGETERLLDIPEWDFDWQGAYTLIDPIKLEAGDRIQMTCEWDNSPENQPYVDGKQIDPRLVTWGEGTLDEMCLGGVTITDG